MGFKNILSLLTLIIVLGFVVTVSAFAADAAADSVTPPPKVASSDTNHDGKPDQWQYYENGQITRTEADTNFDGKVDEIGYFSNGKLVKLEKDSDYDGKMDKWVEY